MDVISLITQKGGAGKSTLAQNIAATAEADGRKVLLIDADPQRSATEWYEIRGRNDAPMVVEVTPAELKQALELAPKNFDLVVIDTPGRDATNLIEQVVKASDLCLLPCRPTMKDIRAQAPTVASVKANEVEAAFVVTHCLKTGSRADAARNGLTGAHGLPVLPEIIPHRVGYADADVLGLTIAEHEPEGKGAQEMQAVWQWIKERLQRETMPTETKERALG